MEVQVYENCPAGHSHTFDERIRQLQQPRRDEDVWKCET